ncbi:MAG: LysM peptidoglycan-binding domain-containing protein [Alphaproteobacteria bacterium]|nr:LysM peptidoglycan-binding domain-containing protein [Alphaproteobacteria bacterium]
MGDEAAAAVVHLLPSAGVPAATSAAPPPVPAPVRAAPVQAAPVQAAPVPAPAAPAPSVATASTPTPAATAPSAQAVTPPPPAVVAVVTPPPPAPRRIAPSFDVVRVSPDGMSVIAGRAEPGAVVSVVEGAREIGRATADARGEWVVILAGALAAGTRELSLVSRGPGDIPELRSERVVVVAVPERAAPQGAGTLAVSMPRDPNASDASRALQIPNVKPAAGGMPLALESVDYDSRGNLVLGGRAPAGAPLLVYVDARSVGRVTTDTDGRWQLTPEDHLAPGVYTLRVDQLGADGRVVQRIELPFSRAEPAQETASESDRIIVQPGNSLWRIARRVYGEGTRYTVIYQANRVMIRDPDLIYPGQIFAVPPRN